MFLLTPPSFPLKRGVILARVSTKRQAESGYSLEYQLQTLRELAEEKGIKVVKEFIGEGERGGDLTRESLWQILEMAKKGEFEYLLVIDLDRLSREDIATILIVCVLHLLGVRVVTPQKKYELEDFSNLILLVLDSFRAKEESKKIGERTRSGKITKFRSKKWVKGHADFGYERDGDWVKKKGGEYDQIIPSIFQLFCSFRSYSKVSKEIKERYKVELSVSQIKRILANPIYVGKPSYAGFTVEDPSLAYIDAETFEKVQKMVKGTHAKKPPKNEAAKGLLRRLGF